MKKQFAIGYFVVGPLAFMALWLLVALSTAFDEIYAAPGNFPVVQGRD
jgi:hypothetical protein